MKLYNLPEGGLTKEELERGLWAFYADVKCTECGKEAALTNVGLMQKCPKCGGQML